MTDFYMAFAEDQSPVGLLQLNDAGEFMRGFGEWNPVSADNRNFDEVEVVEVSDDFIEFFDMLETKDKLPSRQQTNKFKVKESASPKAEESE